MSIYKFPIVRFEKRLKQVIRTMPKVMLLVGLIEEQLLQYMMDAVPCHAS